jgi:hypothetical protein
MLNICCDVQWSLRTPSPTARLLRRAATVARTKLPPASEWFALLGCPRIVLILVVIFTALQLEQLVLGPRVLPSGAYSPGSPTSNLNLQCLVVPLLRRSDFIELKLWFVGIVFVTAGHGVHVHAAGGERLAGNSTLECSLCLCRLAQTVLQVRRSNPRRLTVFCFSFLLPFSCSQVFLPFFLLDSLRLPTQSITIVPLMVSV